MFYKKNHEQPNKKQKVEPKLIFKNPKTPEPSSTSAPLNQKHPLATKSLATAGTQPPPTGSYHDFDRNPSTSIGALTEHTKTSGPGPHNSKPERPNIDEKRNIIKPATNQILPKTLHVDILIDDPHIGVPATRKILPQRNAKTEQLIASKHECNNKSYKTAHTEHMEHTPSNRELTTNPPGLNNLFSWFFINVKPKIVQEKKSQNNLKEKHYDKFNDNLFSDFKQSFVSFSIAIALHFSIIVPILITQPKKPIIEETQNIIEVSLIEEPEVQTQLTQNEGQKDLHNLSWSTQEVQQPIQPAPQLGQNHPTEEVRSTQSEPEEPESKSISESNQIDIQPSIKEQQNKNSSITKSNKQKTVNAKNKSTTIEDKVLLNNTDSPGDKPQNTAQATPDNSQEFQSALIPFLVYPQRAIEQAIEGTTILMISFNEQGSPSNISIMQSSGFTILDNAALKAAQLLPKFKEKALTSIIVPVEFSLN